ncbi:MAG: SanA/YdcF family protein [Thermoleophilia bacterium]
MTRQPDGPAAGAAAGAADPAADRSAAGTAAKAADRPRRRGLRRAAVAAVAALLLLVAGSASVNLLVLTRGGESVAAPADAPSAEVAIVLGARVWPGNRPSPILADRLETGLELYRLGKVEKLLLSGDHGTVPYDEVNAMRTYVMQRGVPAEDVFMDHAGFSTFDSMYRARDVFLVTDVLMVTQDFHLARAVYTARALGLKVTGVSADRRSYRDTDRLAVREWLARCKAFLQLHVFHSGPRFLGPTIPITGDGRATEG